MGAAALVLPQLKFLPATQRSPMIIKMGLFDLIDPPPGQAEKVIAAYKACSYPFQRLIPRLRSDVDQRIIVRWKDMGQSVSGLWISGTNEIHLSNKSYHMVYDTGFVFLHELGHMVDSATLNDAEKAELITIMHTLKPQIGHINHDHPDAGHTSEIWNNSSEPYCSRIKEAFADLFVATFAPTVYNGTSGGPASEEHFFRFVHWTQNLEDIRRVTTQRSIQVFSDVPANHAHKEGIEWAASQGIITGYPDGTFKPNEPVSRGAFATMLKRYDDQA
jgi:predicted small secreted protein